MNITIPPLQKGGECPYNCPFYGGEMHEYSVCNMNWSGTSLQQALSPGPDCPGPGTYRLEKEKS